MNVTSISSQSIPNHGLLFWALAPVRRLASPLERPNASTVSPDTPGGSLRVEEPDGKTLYAQSQTGNGVNELVPINTAAGRPGKDIRVRCSEGDLVMTPNGEAIYIVCPLSNSVIPVHTATGKAGSPIPVGDFPGPIAVTPNGNTAFVASDVANSVTPINAGSGHQHWPGPDVDRDHARREDGLRGQRGHRPRRRAHGDHDPDRHQPGRPGHPHRDQRELHPDRALTARCRGAKGPCTRSVTWRAYGRAVTSSLTGLRRPV